MNEEVVKTGPRYVPSTRAKPDNGGKNKRGEALLRKRQ